MRKYAKAYLVGGYSRRLDTGNDWPESPAPAKFEAKYTALTIRIRFQRPNLAKLVCITL